MTKELLEDILMRLSSRKFLVFLSITLVIVADNFGLQVDPEIRKALITMGIAYLATEGTVDAVRAYNEPKA